MQLAAAIAAASLDLSPGRTRARAGGGSPVAGYVGLNQALGTRTFRDRMKTVDPAARIKAPIRPRAVR